MSSEIEKQTCFYRVLPSFSGHGLPGWAATGGRQPGRTTAAAAANAAAATATTAADATAAATAAAAAGTATGSGEPDEPAAAGQHSPVCAQSTHRSRPRSVPIF